MTIPSSAADWRSVINELETPDTLKRDRADLLGELQSLDRQTAELTLQHDAATRLWLSFVTSGVLADDERKIVMIKRVQHIKNQLDVLVDIRRSLEEARQATELKLAVRFVHSRMLC